LWLLQLYYWFTLGIKLIDLIDQLSHNVIGRLSVKLWCYRLCRLVMSLVHFGPSIVTVKHLCIVSQIVSCAVFLSWSVLLESINKLFVWYWYLSTQWLIGICSKLVNQLSKVSLWEYRVEYVMSLSPSRFDILSVNGVQQCDCWQKSFEMLGSSLEFQASTFEFWEARLPPEIIVFWKNDVVQSRSHSEIHTYDQCLRCSVL